MKKTAYEGYEIQTNDNHTALIYKDGAFVKGVAADVDLKNDTVESVVLKAIEKAKKHIGVLLLAKRFQDSTNPIIKAQYADNAKSLRAMYDKAVKTGKKVNGYTAEMLLEMTLKYEKIANK